VSGGHAGNDLLTISPVVTTRLLALAFRVRRIPQPIPVAPPVLCFLDNVDRSKLEPADYNLMRASVESFLGWVKHREGRTDRSLPAALSVCPLTSLLSAGRESLSGGALPLARTSALFCGSVSPSH
jgi:hypothetical protein